MKYFLNNKKEEHPTNIILILKLKINYKVLYRLNLFYGASEFEVYDYNLTII